MSRSLQSGLEVEFCLTAVLGLHLVGGSDGEMKPLGSRNDGAWTLENTANLIAGDGTLIDPELLFFRSWSSHETA